MEISPAHRKTYTVTEIILFSALLLAGTAALQPLSRWTRIPFTVSLLFLGFGLQLLTREFGWHVELSLPTEVIYSLILPLMLFESAFHINFHQFKLQFRTITFLATFGVMTAIAVVGGMLNWLLGIPLVDALLFGAIIASTDPISVVSLFKELGAPKRLTLVAEGESMFNDATAVIFFRLIAGFAVAQQQFSTLSVAEGVFDFFYLFVGSLALGTVLGYIASQFIVRVKNDRLTEVTLTIALALFSFVGAEHFLHLSGVITTVAAGIVMGNAGRTKISSNVIGFLEEFWEYVAFLGVALVFFFAAFQLDLGIFSHNPQTLGIVIASTLIARAVSVYIGFAFTNFLPFFKKEPNVPLSWQHVLNWGGLRGVIPLVLVYSLPADYPYKEIFTAFTLACFVFSLLVNATTIRQLLILLKLHLPKHEEAILHTEKELFKIAAAKEKLGKLSKEDFTVHVLQDVEQRLSRNESEYQKRLAELSTPKDLEKSLRLQILRIERSVAQRMYEQGHISESILFEFQNELDLQQDALEYPEILKTDAVLRQGGKIDSQERFAHQITTLEKGLKEFPWMQSWLLTSHERRIIDRLSLLHARIVASNESLAYIEQVQNVLSGKPAALTPLKTVEDEQEQMRLKNTFQLSSLEREYPRYAQAFEKEFIERITLSHAK